ncbi:MAG: DUF134 domain-containing protein [Vallitaleaceae bacterium]|jgi:predicted DNA-binding protein (UPF0251 family)|nr:DUF134 domain-containing protein [Vallitaleaceae bacterium]
MARPMKDRKVCKEPRTKVFGPSKYEVEDEGLCIYMSIEEYEVIRLMDYCKHNQISCAEFMGVARSTVQRIYESARQKIASSLVEGKKLVITGGHYTVCEQQEHDGSCNNCK